MARPLTTLDKPLPVIPLSSILSLHLSTSSEFEELFRVTTPLFTAFSKSGTFDAIKRKYALLELLRSERTYASDLVLLRNYQIPLASGASICLSRNYRLLPYALLNFLLMGHQVNYHPYPVYGLRSNLLSPVTTVWDPPPLTPTPPFLQDCQRLRRARRRLCLISPRCRSVPSSLCAP